MSTLPTQSHSRRPLQLSTACAPSPVPAPPQRQTARAEDEATVLRAQLERALSALSIRASAQYEAQVKRRSMASFKLALAARRAEAFAPGAGGASSSAAAPEGLPQTGLGSGGGREDAGVPSAPEMPEGEQQRPTTARGEGEDEDEAKLEATLEATLAFQRENEELKQQLAAMARELEERTEQLVAAKVAAAENDLRGAELTHEVKQLTTKLEIIDFAEVPPPPSSRATRRTTGSMIKRRNSFES